MNLTYSITTTSSSVQTFPLRSSTPISKLRLEITSNWGHTEYTCLYRVQEEGGKKTVIELDSSGVDVIFDKCENYLIGCNCQGNHFNKRFPNIFALYNL